MNRTRVIVLSHDVIARHVALFIPCNEHIRVQSTKAGRQFLPQYGELSGHADHCVEYTPLESHALSCVGVGNGGRGACSENIYRKHAAFSTTYMDIWLGGTSRTTFWRLNMTRTRQWQAPEEKLSACNTRIASNLAMLGDVTWAMRYIRRPYRT